MLDKIWEEMIICAEAVRNGRRLSQYIDAGGVSAAILSSSGKIYTGVCVDTACTLGVCAERNAIFNMITNGESEIKRVLCIMGDGKVGGAPCGACRELIVQLMPDKYKEVEVLICYNPIRIMKFNKLTPDWWI